MRRFLSNYFDLLLRFFCILLTNASLLVLALVFLLFRWILRLF